MDPATRLLYLEAMGIPVWELRQRDSAPPQTNPLQTGSHQSAPLQVESLHRPVMAPAVEPDIVSESQSAQSSTLIDIPATSPATSVATSIQTESCPNDDVAGLPDGPSEVKPVTASVEPAALPEVGIEHWLCDLQLLEINSAVRGAAPTSKNQTMTDAYVTGGASSGLLVLEAPVAPELDGMGATGLSAPAGKMLDAMLAAIGRSRQDTRLGSVSWPSAESGLPLWNLVSTEQSRVVLVFVQPGFHQDTDSLLNDTRPVEMALASRAEVSSAVHCVVSYHPDYLLLNPSLKRSVWEDLKLVSSLLGTTE